MWVSGAYECQASAQQAPIFQSLYIQPSWYGATFHAVLHFPGKCQLYLAHLAPQEVPNWEWGEDAKEKLFYMQAVALPLSCILLQLLLRRLTNVHNHICEKHIS